ncbi:MAG: hypothetical protein H3C43_06205 [Leptonema sp. (in: Bacteria)]|nr:hypothetical protein [Leptonema sp. (in: bacteria)]
MSSVALILFIVNLCLIIGGAAWIKTWFQFALTSVEEKQGGVVGFYKLRLAEFFKLQSFSKENIVCGIHYILLHLITPLLLSSFLLHTDANFFVAIGAIVATSQLLVRVFPGEEDG